MVAWATAITESQLIYCLYWVTDFHSVYNRSLTLTLFIPRHCLLTVFMHVTSFNFIKGVISITPVSLGRRALGRPEHSCRAITAALTGGLPRSVSPC